MILVSSHVTYVLFKYHFSVSKENYRFRREQNFNQDIGSILL